MPTSDLAQQLFAALPRGPALVWLPRFFAIPGDEPRWLIPAAGGNVHSALQNWSPFRLSSRLKWKAIRAANRLGVVQALPTVTTTPAETAGEIDWRALGWNHRMPPTAVIYLGTAGTSRKAVVHLVDPVSGNCEAVVKVPLAPGARAAILHEADQLVALADEGYPFSPRLLHIDRERGIATQQFLAGHSGSRHLRPEYWSLLQSLVLHDEHTNLSDHAAAWNTQLLSSPAHRSEPELVESVLTELFDVQGLPACWVHGDFAPWNIRRRPHGAAALIDWEEAERNGLPLQDAYHFLHMQDFLFGNRPTSHFADVQPFAKTLDIASQQCRKLEIAYLIRAYLKCSSSGQMQRAEFLLKTLALLFRDRAASAIVAMRSSRLRLVSSHPANVASVRAELFDALVAQLNQAKLPYCILSGYEDNPETDAFDVDIMFRPRDLHRVPALLARTAESVGASLAQSIPHETTACYFVLVRKHGKHIAHLDVDCYSDYRRDARTWMLADDVIAHRREYRDFYVPSVADEFTYYLIKKVLKQFVTSHHLHHLQRLVAGNPAGCQRRVESFWPPQTALLLQEAIVEQKLAWFQGQLPNLLVELQRSPLPGSALRRGTQKVRQARRFLQRIIFPTGFSVVVTGGNDNLRSELADGLMCNLSPVFRRTRKLETAGALSRFFAQIFEVRTARVRSTLVVRPVNDDLPATGLRQAARRLESILARLLAPCDLVLTLRSKQGGDGSNAASSHRKSVCLDADAPQEQILQNACEAILHRLAGRCAKRLKLRTPARHGAMDSAAKYPELRSARLD